MSTVQADAGEPGTLGAEIFGEFIGREDMAKLLKVSVRTLVRMTHKSNGLPHLTLGKRTLYRVDSVRKWLAEQEIRPSANGRKRRAS